MNKNLIEKGKLLAYILRHNPGDFNLTIETDGWVIVSDLLSNTDFTIDELNYIVDNDNKQRYSFNFDKSKIRANQGHSIPNLKINFELVSPPDILFHVTSSTYINSIMKSGLDKRQRQYVHLSDSINTAKNVGNRHKNGYCVILEIDSKQMLNDGYIFYISENKVYLTDNVPTKYIKIKK
jgi:putative RNA 2'-phosphotransferase